MRRKVIRRALASVAMLFGVVTIFAGGRVLLGGDPGYSVFRPLLAFNTAMGVVYVVAGIVAWLNVARGKTFAGAIFAVNCVVLMALGYLRFGSGEVATQSLQAMALRTVVWLVLFLGLAWLSRRRHDIERGSASQ